MTAGDMAFWATLFFLSFGAVWPIICWWAYRDRKKP